MNRSDELPLVAKAAAALAAGDRAGAVEAVRALFTLVELDWLLAHGDPEARHAADLLVASFMPIAKDEAEFLVRFAQDWTRS